MNTLTTTTLAATLRVSRRTAARYIAATLVLAEVVGWSVRYDHGKRSYVLASR